MMKLPKTRNGFAYKGEKFRIYSCLFKLTQKHAWTAYQKAIAHYFDPDWYYQNEEKYGLPIATAADLHEDFGGYEVCELEHRDEFVEYSLGFIRGIALEASKNLSKADKAFLKHCYKTGDYGEKWLQIIDRLIKPFLMADRSGGYFPEFGDTMPPKGTEQRKLADYSYVFGFVADSFELEDVCEYKSILDCYGMFCRDSIFKGE